MKGPFSDATQSRGELPRMHVVRSICVLSRPFAAGTGKVTNDGKSDQFSYLARKLRKSVADFLLETRATLSEAAKVLVKIGVVPLVIADRPKLALTIGTVALVGATEKAHGCLRPPGTDDAPYVAAGETLQTNLLSFKVLVPGVGSGERNTSAVLWNNENGITAAHNVTDLLQYNPTYEVGTGPNYMTNRGTVIAVDHITINADLDIAVFHLASCLPNVNVTIATNRPAPGEVVTSGGFGRYGVPGGTAERDGNSRSFRAPMISTSGSYPAESYFSTAFYPYVTLNGQGLSGDSGGVVRNATGELIGIMVASEDGMPSIGSTTSLDVTHSGPKAYNFIVQNLITSQPTLSLSPTKDAPAVHITGKANQVYTLQRSYDLSSWSDVGIFTNQTGVVSWPDPDSASHATGFYRGVVK